MHVPKGKLGSTRLDQNAVTIDRRASLLLDWGRLGSMLEDQHRILHPAALPVIPSELPAVTFPLQPL